MSIVEVESYKLEGSSSNRVDFDPIATQVIQHGLDAAADQMSVTVRRTAFSPVIYDARDFAGAFFDPQGRLIAQTNSLPIFLGSLGFVLKASLERLGGSEALEPGDVIVSNYALDTGSHQNDVAIIVPGFDDGKLMCFAVAKAHFMDVGGAWLFATHTTSIFQEGIILPSVRLYRAGELDEDMLRLLLANTRVPEIFQGDLTALIGACRRGIDAVRSVAHRYGVERFNESLELIFDRGERQMREFIDQIPDGRYESAGFVDDDGITDDPVPWKVAVEVRGSDLVVDVTDAASQRPGPINCPPATVVSSAWCAILALIAGGESANEGWFRPIEVKTKPGTIFNASHPAPMGMSSWPSIHVIDHIHRSLADVMPNHVVGQPGADVSALNAWGTRSDGSVWADGSIISCGQGASAQYGDGGSPLMHIVCSGSRATSWEVWESRTPFLIENHELACDSGGAGKWRGGLGIDTTYRVLEQCTVTVPWERTKSMPFGLHGGGFARPSSVIVEWPDGTETRSSKLSAADLPPGTRMRLDTGGGGGYGPAEERDPSAVHTDIKEGYISEAAARRDYPHAF